MERTYFTQEFFMNNEWQDFLLHKCVPIKISTLGLKRPQDYVRSWLGTLSTKVDIDVQEEVTYLNKFWTKGCSKTEMFRQVKNYAKQIAGVLSI